MITNTIFPCLPMVIVIVGGQDLSEKQLIGSWEFKKTIPHMVNPPRLLYSEPSMNDLKGVKFKGSDIVTLTFKFTSDHRFLLARFRISGEWRIEKDSVKLMPDYHSGLDFLNNVKSGYTNGSKNLILHWSTKDHQLHWLNRTAVTGRMSDKNFIKKS